MAISFAGIVGNLQSLGFYDFVLPWLLFFAVILGVLNTSGVIGKSGRVNAIVSAVIAFFIMAFTPVGTSLAAYLTTLFGVGGMIVAVFIVIVLLGGILGFKPADFLTKDGKTAHEYAYPLVGIVILILVALAFGAATGTGISIPGIDSSTATILMVLIFVVLVILFAESGEKAATK